MSRVVFFSIPAQGHTNPTLAVVQELVRRGHQVRYYSFEPFREKIEAAGAEFRPCEEFDAEAKLTPEEGKRVGSDLVLSTRVLAETTLALDAPVCEEMAVYRPDCIVADSMAVWGKAVARKLGIPFVCSTTTFAFNQHSARIMRQSPAQLLSLLFSQGKLQRQIRRLQAQGYPVNSVLDLIGSDETVPTIVYTSPQFQPAAETFGENFAFVGPSIRPAQSEFPKIREKLVYISMGTVNNDLLPLYRACVAALADTPWQAILSVGHEIDIQKLGPLPENITIRPSVDQIAVLQKADVFLTHCGMNSVSEALYFGVPLVSFPQTAEQGGVARRAQQLGAALPLKKAAPQEIRSALGTVLTTPSFRESAAAISTGFRACSGPAGAADLIEGLCPPCASPETVL